MNDFLLIIFASVLGGLSILFRSLYALTGRVGHYEVKRKAQLRQPGARAQYQLHQRGYEPLISFSLWQNVFTVCFILVLI